MRHIVFYATAVLGFIAIALLGRALEVWVVVQLLGIDI